MSASLLHPPPLPPCTDQCVEHAVRDACDLGYLVTLVTDACATYSEQRHQVGDRALCRAGQDGLGQTGQGRSQLFRDKAGWQRVCT